MDQLWEDNLLERKTEGDLKDLLKTMVAFANSVRPGHTALILIGEKDDGTIQGVTNADTIQKKVKEQADKIYPAIIARWKPYEADGKWCVRVEIEFSGDTPHFGGPAWVRKGSQTSEATTELFQQLIEIRSGKIFELSKWLNEFTTIVGDLATVPIDPRPGTSLHGGAIMHRWGWAQMVRLISVNQFWLTVETDDKSKHAEPLDKISLSFDHENERLKIIVVH